MEASYITLHFYVDRLLRYTHHRWEFTVRRTILPVQPQPAASIGASMQVDLFVKDCDSLDKEMSQLPRDCTY